jgi:HEAT repeat protein
MHWRGERLSDDTLYALAVTGISWEIAWNHDHPFSLAWGEYSRAPRLNGQSGKNDAEFIEEVRRAYERHDYRRAVDTAASHFTLEQIGCESTLKETVGKSLMAMGQSEQAFPVFAAPFAPGLNPVENARANRRFREEALDAAQHAGLKREVVAFALSLLLEPGLDAPTVDAARMDALVGMGVDIDRVVLGILQSPNRLRGLPAYTYVAADLLTYRASPRMLPILARLAENDDVYLRSRAVTGLGILAYHARPDSPGDWQQRLLNVPLHETGVSASERKVIDRAVKEALNSDRFRLRVAGIVALTLMGESESVPILQRLTKDRAYILTAPNGERDKKRLLYFPVWTAAAAGLYRFGMRVDVGGGDLSGKELDREKRGGRDETNDRRNLRRDIVSQLALSPFDVPVPHVDETPRF